MGTNEQKSFEELSRSERQSGFFLEFWDFLRNNKKWWLTPIVVIMLLFGAMIFLSGTAAAPFIYTLF